MTKIIQGKCQDILKSDPLFRASGEIALTFLDPPFNQGKELRSCFYLVRTHSQTYSQVRISLVEGSFFETLPKDKLMQAIWRQLLEARGVKEIEREQIVEILGDLDQSEIALSREPWESCGPL